MLYIKEENTSISPSTNVVSTIFDGSKISHISLVKLD